MRTDLSVTIFSLFFFFTNKFHINCGYLIDVLYQVEEVSYYFYLFSVFIMNRYWIFVKCTYWDDHVVFFLIQLMIYFINWFWDF